MFCQACIVQHHQCLPLHRIEKWTSTFFDCTTLKSLGMRIQLGHNPARWYPATTTDPQTAASFAVSAYEHSGRGHHPTGANGTKSGELAVLCPACLHPGKNLLDGWETAPPLIQQKAVSLDDMDPGLNAGWAYFVEETKYNEYLSLQAGERQEQSTCVSHNAVNMADTKLSHGLAATGVGTVDCARHEFKLPTGVGDLQKGEKYKLWTRMDSMPAHLHIAHNTMLILQYFVPKFHIGAHIAACQTTFSWNLAKSVGRTDGEAPERGWENINRVASSTKEMGPGSRTLKHKIEDAVKWKREHSDALHELEETIQSVLLDEWRLEIKAWEDNGKPNPFKSRVTHKQRETITNRTNVLQRRIDSWICTQELYMPVVLALCSSANYNATTTDAVLKPQHLPLYLPSALDAPVHCDQHLLEHEWELRHAQAHDALNEICSHLRLPLHIYKFKDKNLHGQAASTRAQNLITHVEAKKEAGVDKYRRAHRALESLNSRLDKDMRPMGDFIDGCTQGTGTISWIWLATDVGTIIGLCIEWCKARTHAARWSEEVELLWQVRWWDEHANLRIMEKPSNQEGLQAYAYCQVALCSVMCRSFQVLWSGVPQLVASTLEPEVFKLNDTIHTPSIDHPPDLYDEPLG
ncbi:uncharacterized protein EDB93DRAFT_1243656 [Suillus bovinus]|uniref:uncharacterized protein n=1 Tax=Suillus bovinus TaxID=48563 RepID=UPI001B878107|nr:uncharacterized protein EDB93DRAFT_1243656 [Suillus bovinus]KAG2127647.1 hypothetical protein EDB93DRAFT_1243656 [Suillus bovinus]